ncbi:hypothetical protein OROMI_033470 [Orobanche minor]
MNYLNMTGSPMTESPYELLLRAAFLIPISHYFWGISLIIILFLYNFMDIHFLEDLFSGFRGQPVTLTFNSSSQLYRDVVSKCGVLHGRYLSTPWLSSPHLQTIFVHYFGNPPAINYRRQVFTAPDGGTIALDWVINAKVNEPVVHVNEALGCDGRNPIIIIIPGLASASDSAYVKHLAYKMAKSGCNVVVSNHRGLGGVPITVNNDLVHHKAKSPSKLQQELKALNQDLHEDVLSRLSNWEAVKQTVDTYYRKCSSCNYVGSVMVPLLCISSLDDPVRTSEAIPRDECRLKDNVVLATTKHRGHLPFFEGLTAKSIWWVRAVDEFFDVLKSISLNHRQREIAISSENPLQTSVDEAPFVKTSGTGIVSAVGDNLVNIRHEKQNMGIGISRRPSVMKSTGEVINDMVAPITKYMDQVSSHN